MEHLPCGDLLGYMRKCRGINDRYYLGEGRPQVLNNYDLVLFAKQIAAGMVFLGSRGVSNLNASTFNFTAEISFSYCQYFSRVPLVLSMGHLMSLLCWYMFGL